MGVINNGGAQAIKGFNYQKSIIALIAVLHYLDTEVTDLYIESEDDIVVKTGSKKTYIQSKSTELTVSSIINRKDGKDSILEKNLSSGDEDDSRYKLVTPRFGSYAKHLQEDMAEVFTAGAQVYSYTELAKTKIKTDLPSISEDKLNRSRVALTSFPARQSDALTHIKGIMSDMDIPIDNSFGSASLGELCLRIDQKSEVMAKNKADYEKKKITQQDLRQIFGHTHKSRHYEDIINSLGYNHIKKAELMSMQFTLGAHRSAYIDIGVKSIKAMDNLLDLDTHTILTDTIDSIAFNADVTDLEKEGVAISALSQVTFEKSQVC